MSFSIKPQNLQIWENAAFEDAGDTAGAKPWLPLQPISVNLSRVPNPSRKEKQIRTPNNPLRTAKPFMKPGMQEGGAVSYERNIEAEIEDIENEIRRLSMRLESLRIEKIEGDIRAGTAHRGRIVPAKFMEQKACPVYKKMEGPPASAGLWRGGFSLGPLEMHGSTGKSCFQKLDGIKEETLAMAQPFENVKADVNSCKKKTADCALDALNAGYRRRGLSLGPTEIAAVSRLRFPSKLQEVKDRGKSVKRQGSSVSPKSRKQTVSELRKGISTVGSMKSLEKREGAPLGSLKPKGLFQKGQNSVTCKKPLKNTSVKMRVVASRYSLAVAPSVEPERKRRKWSLPEPFQGKTDGTENKLVVSLGESNEFAARLNGEAQIEPLLIANSPPSIMKIASTLPRIKTLYGTAGSPRDSGCAKRAAQLVGKKHHFSMEDGEVSAVSPPSQTRKNES